MRVMLVLSMALGAGLLAGCGSGSAESTTAAFEVTEERSGSGAAKPSSNAVAEPASNDAAQRAKKPKGVRIKVVSSTYGRVVADAKGEALYLFDTEGGKRSKCYGACARAWPPVLTKGRPRARGGAKQRLLGTTRRKNGKLQVTYAGHPLYYYVGDSPGTILCHDVDEFGGTWLVVKPSGRAA